MKLTLLYILSQIFIILNYVFLVIAYQVKTKEKALLFNNSAQFSAGLSFICLGAYTGLAMALIAILRNTLFLINEKKHNKKHEMLILLLIYLLMIILSIITFNGFLSLMSVFATMLATYALWQNNSRLYRILGIPISLLWITYNIYIGSIFGIVLEFILMTSAIIGFYNDKHTNTTISHNNN